MDFKYVIYIGASREEVWQALISPEGTKATFFDCIIKSTFEIGAPYEYVGPGSDGDETVHVYGNVLSFVPNQELSLTEHPGPSYRDNHTELQSRMTFHLEEVGSCTKLTLVNDQWTENNPSYEHSQENWPMIMSNIKTYAETGKTLVFG